jgi:hypothetical protein
VEQGIVISLRDKVLEAVERTSHLVSKVPDGLVAWTPTVLEGTSVSMDVAHLLGHILDCSAGFCAAFYAAFPSELSDLLELRRVKVNQPCLPGQSLEAIERYRAGIARGFECCTSVDLNRKIKTVFVPEGETLLTLLLGNLEHLLNHKYQLFFYLKLAGVQVNSMDLYRYRGAPQKD